MVMDFNYEFYILSEGMQPWTEEECRTFEAGWVRVL